ncbi:MAG: LysR family transcriptional regulator [Xanthomonadaceae bacterium]|jgi:DNA-binding transcriptional LysR family regulator|nr:LysR family transcriptional regulator [Xanthomonadaceae bacterium]
MQVFVATVRGGSMTAAGMQCGISTTMVSNHLRALEQRLGTSLLRRSTRRQSLTEFGATYYQRCLDILGMVDEAEKLAQDAQASPRGTLRITAPPTFGAECLVPSLAGYLASYPHIKLDLLLTDRIVDLAEEGFDAAIRLGSLDTSQLVARPLRDYGLRLCASPAYLTRKGSPVTPADLCTHDCLSFAYPAGTEWRWTEKQWRMTGPEGELVIPIDSRISLNHAQGLRRAALGGLGIAMLPDALIAQDLEQGLLKSLLTDYTLPTRPVHLLYAQERYRSLKLRSFVEHVVKTFGAGQ